LFSHLGSDFTIALSQLLEAFLEGDDIEMSWFNIFFFVFVHTSLFFQFLNFVGSSFVCFLLVFGLSSLSGLSDFIFFLFFAPVWMVTSSSKIAFWKTEELKCG